MNLFQDINMPKKMDGAFFDSMKVFAGVGLMMATGNPALASFGLYLAHQAATDFLKKVVATTVHEAGSYSSPSKLP